VVGAERAALDAVVDDGDSDAEEVGEDDEDETEEGLLGLA